MHPAQQVTCAHLEGYLAGLDHRGLTGNTSRRKVASLRSFFGHLDDAGLRQSDPARRLSPPEREHLQPRYLTEREYKALWLLLRYEGEQDQRDQAERRLLERLW